MAITTNTKRTIERASTVLAPACKATQDNMDALLKKAGCKTNVKKVLVPIPANGEKDDVIYVGLNGQKFYFQRGKTVYVPEPVMQQMINCGLFQQDLMDMYKTAKE